MQAIMIDDSTYRAWKEQASAQGLSIEDWLKQKTASPDHDSSLLKPEDLTVEERLARFDCAVAEIERMNIRSEKGVDWSREAIYGERDI